MANHTKQLLAESLKELLTHKPVDKITVKEIVAGCGVNRQTFYYNFHDIYDLMEWILLEDARQIIGTGTVCKDWVEVMSKVFKYLQDNEDRTLNAFHSMSRASLRNCIKSVFYPIMETILDSQPNAGRLSSENRKFLLDVYVLLLTGIVIEWIEGGMRGDYMFELNRLKRVIDCTATHLIDEFSMTI